MQEAYAKGLDLTDEYVQSLISKLDSAKSAMASMYDGVIESFASQIEMNDTIASITGGSANSQNMTVLKGEEKYINTAYNAGLIDTNQYINDMTKNLQNQYKAISDAAKETQQNAVDSIKKQKEALQGVIDSLEELKSNYESAASAVSALIDKQRGYAQEQLDASKALQAAIVKQIDLEKEELETLKEQAETRKGDMETAANAVISYIDERIDALKEENDELDRQKQIEEALLELERLKNQRNKRVYREGVGFVWESDQAAIDEAQTKYDNLVSENEKQKQIDDLEAYKRAWQEALDAYTQAADAEKAISVFGDNWKGFVESLDYEAIAKFGEEYSDVQQYIEVDLASQIDLLEKQAEAWGNVLDLNDEINQYEEQLGILNQFTSASEAERWQIFDEFSAKFAEDTRILQTWDDYKSKWEEATSAYEEDIERQHAASILGADWEQAILEQRTDIIDNWATGYKKVSDDIIYNQEVQMAELDALEESWASCFDGISGTMDTSLMQMKFFTDEYNAALESISANLAKLSDLKLAGIEGGVIDKMKANSTEWNDIQAQINAIDKEIEKADYTIGLEWDAEDVENAKADKKRLLAEREELIRQQKELEDANLLLGTSAGLTRDDASGVWYRSDGSNAYEARDTSDLTNISSTGNSFFDFALGKGAYANDAALLGKEDVVSTAAGNLKTTSTGWQVKSAQENTFDIGDIIIQSCNDSDELAKDIMKNLGNAMIQLMNRK